MKWFVCIIGLATLVACGDSGSSSDGESTSDTDSSSESTFECCLNGTFYDCPDKAALDTCSQFDPSGCSADASRDSECE